MKYYVLVVLTCVFYAQVGVAEIERYKMPETFEMDKLKEELIDDEGVRDYAYQDSLGYFTIGIGHLIDKRVGGKISQDTIHHIFKEDIAEAVQQLDDNLFWWRSLDPVRQRALINLCFNMGINKLLGFQNFLAHSQAGDYKKATEHLLDSKWARQVQKSRVERITQQWEYGV